VIAFPAHRVKPAGDAPLTAEILLFLGVRYERQPETAAALLPTGPAPDRGAGGPRARRTRRRA
jgi:hypothetical protein